MKMKVFLTVGFIMIFCTSMVCGESIKQKYTSKAPEEQLDKSFVNGRYWLKLSDSNKTFYLLGFMDGVWLVTRFLSKKAKNIIIPEIVSHLKVEEVNKLIDAFYEDTYNLNIPIFQAYNLVMIKANGATPEEFEERVAQTRAYWR